MDRSGGSEDQAQAVSLRAILSQLTTARPDQQSCLLHILDSFPWLRFPRQLQAVIWFARHCGIDMPSYEAFDLT